MKKWLRLLKVVWLLRNNAKRNQFKAMLNKFLAMPHNSITYESDQEKAGTLGECYITENYSFDSKHKILLVTHELSRTGAPYATLYLARALLSLKGVHPVILSLRDGPLRQEFEDEGFPIVIYPLLFSDLNNSFETCEFIGGFERVIAISLASYKFINQFRGVAKQLTWWIHETEAGFTSVAGMTTNLSLLFASCNCIWLGSPLCYPLALQYVKQEKIHQLLYGCADNAFQYQQPESTKIIFSIFGSVEPRKGQDVFLDAIKLLPAELRKKAIFRIIGSSLPYEASENFFNRILRCSKKIFEVELIPNMPLNELYSYYAQADVVVSASRDDPMPIVITQALMFSKACICSSAIGHAQLMEDGKNGLVFRNESVEDLYQKMVWVLNNLAEVAHIGEEGRKIYEKHFHTASFNENLKNLIH